MESKRVKDGNNNRGECTEMPHDNLYSLSPLVARSSLTGATPVVYMHYIRRKHYQIIKPNQNLLFFNMGMIWTTQKITIY